MHSFTVPAQHVVVVHNRRTYNFYVVQVTAKEQVGGVSGNSVVIDRNRDGHAAWVYSTAEARTHEALRKIMDGASAEHLAAAWNLLQGLAGA